jgi:hypothetical protein
MIAEFFHSLRGMEGDLIRGKNIEKTSVVEEKTSSFSGSPKGEIDLGGGRPSHSL